MTWLDFELEHLPLLRTLELRIYDDEGVDEDNGEYYIRRVLDDFGGMHISSYQST